MRRAGTSQLSGQSHRVQIFEHAKTGLIGKTCHLHSLWTPELGPMTPSHPLSRRERVVSKMRLRPELSV